VLLAKPTGAAKGANLLPGPDSTVYTIGPSRWIKPGGRSGTVGHKLVPPGQLIDACTRPHGSRTTGHREHDVAGSVAFTVDALATEVTADPPHAIHVIGAYYASQSWTLSVLLDHSTTCGSWRLKTRSTISNDGPRKRRDIVIVGNLYAFPPGGERGRCANREVTSSGISSCSATS